MFLVESMLLKSKSNSSTLMKKINLVSDFDIIMLPNSYRFYRLESLNEKRSGVVQMVKLAEKERDGLEVHVVYILVHHPLICNTY